ncbi:hypothetical protein ACLOJK_036484 [Asimina triloba]
MIWERCAGLCDRSGLAVAKQRCRLKMNGAGAETEAVLVGTASYLLDLRWKRTDLVWISEIYCCIKWATGLP